MNSKGCSSNWGNRATPKLWDSRELIPSLSGPCRCSVFLRGSRDFIHLPWSTPSPAWRPGVLGPPQQHGMSEFLVLKVWPQTSSTSFPRVLMDQEECQSLPRPAESGDGACSAQCFRLLQRSLKVGCKYEIQGSKWSLGTAQFSSVAQSCPTPCDPVDCSTPGLPVHHQLPEFTQTHVH